MKKHIATLILFLYLLTPVISQDPLDYREYYIGTGYSIGWAQFGPLNSILDQYNENNTQEIEFGNIHIPNGFAFSLGTHISIFNFEGGFSQRQQRKKTEFSANNILMRRDSRLRINTFFIGAGVFFPTTTRFGFGTDVYLDRHTIRLSTREGEEDRISRAGFISPLREKRYGLTFDLTFYFGQMDDHGTKLMVKPFYSFIFRGIDAAPFNEVLNQDTSGESLTGNYSHVGLKFIITYSVVR